MAGFVILSSEEMRSVEAAAIKSGISAASLMETAGAAIAEKIKLDWTARPVAVICGPGNNGGDGYVVARMLQQFGWQAKALYLGDKDQLAGDAKLMADLFEGEKAPFSAEALTGIELIVDAIFGIGLSRDLDDEMKQAVDAINANRTPVISIDFPSGIQSDTGLVMGAAISAAKTITFFERKPGHILFPGRAHCGVVDVVDIGLTAEHAANLRPTTFENGPPVWGAVFRRPTWMTHKYHRGHVYAVSGPAHRSGAIRLAARGALRAGAGLVTVLAQQAAMAVHASQLNSIMLSEITGTDDLKEHLDGADKYPKVCVIGPAAGVGTATCDSVLGALSMSASCVLDADALTSFVDDPAALLNSLRPDDILTPHEGEFARVFPAIDLTTGRLNAARAAAEQANAVIVLKGPDTVIAAPDGRAAITTNAPPDLSTAGSGDVLAGLIAGFRAQTMPGFEAACCGVWFHGAAAQTIGPGLIAEDLPDALPEVLRVLLTPPDRSAQPNATG